MSGHMSGQWGSANMYGAGGLHPGDPMGHTFQLIREDENSFLDDDDEVSSVGGRKRGIDDVDGLEGRKTGGRRKIPIEFIEDKSRRHITFSKRKAGIMKKAYELSTLTGTQVLLLVASETGHVYTFATPKLQPLITKPEGKNLIQTCLNAPDIAPLGDDADDAYESGGMPQPPDMMGGLPPGYQGMPGLPPKGYEPDPYGHGAYSGHPGYI